jgi:D-glycero-D-manno-heptose 1,7-bisphosphate phosphatase
MDRLTSLYDLWIFDADDTLRRTTVPGQPCPHRPGEWELLPGVAERLRSMGWGNPGGPRFGIASNQDRVGFGRMTERTARDLLRDVSLAATGITPPEQALQLCPHLPDARCDCRKPRPGMLLRIMTFYGARPERTVFVGNHESDRRAAAAAGVDYIDAADFFSSSVEPSARRSRRTPPRRAEGSYGADEPRTTRA